MKKVCILCGSNSKLTAEHIFLSSLLKEFNNIENKEKDKLFSFNNRTGWNEFSNIKRAKSLKPIKNICSKCNSEVSTKCDEVFKNFILEMFQYGKNNISLDKLDFPDLNFINEKLIEVKKNSSGDITDESIFYDLIVDYSSKNIVVPLDKLKLQFVKQYICKHAICYFHRSNKEFPEALRSGFLHHDYTKCNLELNFYILPSEFLNYGYHNTSLLEYKSYYKYKIVFSNVLVDIKFSKK